MLGSGRHHHSLAVSRAHGRPAAGEREAPTPGRWPCAPGPIHIPGPLCRAAGNRADTFCSQLSGTARAWQGWQGPGPFLVSFSELRNSDSELRMLRECVLSFVVRVSHSCGGGAPVSAPWAASLPSPFTPQDLVSFLCILMFLAAGPLHMQTPSLPSFQARGSSSPVHVCFLHSPVAKLTVLCRLGCSFSGILLARS